MPSQPDWGEFEEVPGSVNPGAKKDYHTDKLVSSKTEKELLIGNEKRPSSTSKIRRSCSKVVTKTVIGADGRKEVKEEVVTSEDGADCGDTDFSFSRTGGLGDFPSDLSDFFNTDSTRKTFEELTRGFDSKRQSMGSSSDIFRDLEESDSHHFEVPELSSSSKTSSYSRKTVTTSKGSSTVESGDEDHEARRATTTRKGKTRSRTTRGIHTSPLEKLSLSP